MPTWVQDAGGGGGIEAGFFRESTNSVSIASSAGYTNLSFPAADEGAGVENRIVGSASGWTYDDDSVTVPVGIYLLSGGGYFTSSNGTTHHHVAVRLITGFPAGHAIGSTHTLPTGGGLLSCAGWEVAQVNPSEVVLSVSQATGSARTFDSYHLSIVKVG